jgi:hypothetical protein
MSLCKAIILEGENKGKQCTRLVHEELGEYCGKHKLDARCKYVHPYGVQKDKQCMRKASDTGYCIHHSDYKNGQCKAVIEQGVNKGKQCSRPAMERHSYCGKHQTAKHIEEIIESGKYLCYTHRCANPVDTETSYCDECKTYKNTILLTSQCEAIIIQGERAGLRCLNTTDEKYCEKHTERCYLREYVKAIGKKVCGNGARCTEIIDSDKSHCDKCLEYSRKKDAERLEKKKDTSRCYKCGRQEKEFAKTKKSKLSRFCKECYAKMRLVEDKRHRKVSTQTPEVYYEDYKRDAALRKRTFELSIDKFRSLISKPCVYCGKIEELEYNGVDRIDNSKGYHFDNCVAACKLCNLMKSNHSVNEFRSHARAIYLYTSTKMPSESRLLWKHKNQCSYNLYKSKSAKRGLEFTLSEDEYHGYKLGTCYLCGTVGNKECQNGIDRVDSSKGYISSNCKSCCPWCNRFKNTTPLDVFVNQCEKIATIGNIIVE